MSGDCSKRSVVVIGAGVIGASIAYYLARTGAQVTVIDRIGPSAGASGASDGSVSVATKAPGVLMNLAIRSREQYVGLADKGGVMQGAYFSRSTFLAAANDWEVAAMHAQADELSRAGVSLKVTEGSDIQKSIPCLASNISGLVEVQGEGHAVGYKVVDRFLRASGAKVICEASALKLQPGVKSGRGPTVQTSEGVIEADDVVVAAGLGSNALLPWLNLWPRRGQLIVTERRRSVYKLPGNFIFASYLLEKKKADVGQSVDSGSAARACALVIDPLPYDQYLIGGTREEDDDDQHTEFAAVQRILARAVEYMPFLGEMSVIRVFAGVRAATPDGLPYLGQVKEAPGLWVATGFEGDGICLAPLAGDAMARMMAGKDIPPGVEALAPDSPQRKRRES
ncbi:MAG: FAD-dependent oxidoreductase [Proteobacteria bacterium]|nr:MAG: FAD-dependent oxidoreductase [Pseudomonadota bacterium]